MTMKAEHTRQDEHWGERLSAFLDGELNERQMKALAARLETDAEARRRYGRFAQIAAHLSGDGQARVDASGIAARVSAALADEPTVLAPREWRKALRLPRLALGAALAAGVAMVAVTLAPQLIGQRSPAPALLPEAQTFAFAPRMSVPADGLRTVSLEAGPRHAAQPPVARKVAPAGRWKVLEPAMRERLTRYLLQHNEVAGQIGAQRPSAHVSFVSAQYARP